MLWKVYMKLRTGSEQDRTQTQILNGVKSKVIIIIYPMGSGALSSRVKRSSRKAKNSPPSRAEVKNGGAITPLPLMFSWHNV
jgi:hypothetical protein